jgi:hypothetical protein
MSLLFEI